MQYTTRFKLNKPDLTDDVDIRVLNGNLDIIDAKVASTEDVKDAYDLADSREPSISKSVITDFWSGTKTWRDLATDVRGIALTGLSIATNAAITATDTILAAFGKLQKQINEIPVKQKGTNIFVGNGGENNIGNANVSLGVDALLNTTVGSLNTAIGNNSLSGNTGGRANVAIGFSALEENSDGFDNTSVGAWSLFKNSTGVHNTAIGYESLKENTVGVNNTAIGIQSLLGNTTGYENTGIGKAALAALSSGNFNTSLGSESLKNVTSGEHNVGIGYAAGFYISGVNSQMETSNQSVFIGSNSRGSVSDNQTNQIVIGYGAHGQGSNTAHIGNTMINTISFGTGTGTAFTNRSDPRIKEDIELANLEMCYNDIKNLPLHRFKYKDFVGNSGDKHLTGFLSSEFAELLPKAVHKNTQSFDARDSNGNIIYETRIIEELDKTTGEMQEVEKEVPKQILIENCESIDTSQIVPTLFGAVQFLMQKVESLEKQISEKEMCV